MTVGAEPERVLFGCVAPFSDEENTVTRPVIPELNDGVLEPFAAAFEVQNFWQRVVALGAERLEGLGPNIVRQRDDRVAPEPSVLFVVVGMNHKGTVVARAHKDEDVFANGLRLQGVCEGRSIESGRNRHREDLARPTSIGQPQGVRCLVSLWIFGAFACVGQPVVSPPSQIHGGMNPSAAVDASLASFRDQGFVLDGREDAETFAAFGAHHPDGRSVIRIASERGWVLAVTAPSEGHSRPWVRLLPGALDADGNGHAELLVAAPDVVRDVICASMVEVVDGGVVERHIDFATFGGEGCLIGHSPDDSLVAQVFYPALSRGVVPQVRVTLGRGLRVESAVGVAAEPVEGEEMALRWARAVEAAATRFVLGEGIAAQVQAFEVLSGCGALDSDCRAVRELIEHGWARGEEE